MKVGYTHPALTHVMRRPNAVIFNPHNPNHTHGNRPRTFAWDPYVFRDDPRTPTTEARTPERTPFVLTGSQPPPRAPQPPPPPAYTPMLVDQAPLDVGSRVVPQQALPSVPPQVLNGDLVGIPGSRVHGVVPATPVVRTIGHMPDPNPFGSMVGSDLPVFNIPHQSAPSNMVTPHGLLTIVPLDRTVGRLPASNSDMFRFQGGHVPGTKRGATQLVGDTKRARLDFNTAAKRPAGTVLEGDQKRPKLDFNTAGKRKNDDAGDSLVKNARRRLEHDVATRQLRELVVDSAARNARARVEHDVATRRLREQVVDSVARNARARAHDSATRQLRERALDSIPEIPLVRNVRARAARGRPRK